jgi:hypothetical protein
MARHESKDTEFGIFVGRLSWRASPIEILPLWPRQALRFEGGSKPGRHGRPVSECGAIKRSAIKIRESLVTDGLMATRAGPSGWECCIITSPRHQIL